MRSLEEYEAAKRAHLANIQRLKDDDAMFPDDPVHTNAIRGAQEAIRYIEEMIECHHK